MSQVGRKSFPPSKIEPSEKNTDIENPRPESSSTSPSSNGCQENQTPTREVRPVKPFVYVVAAVAAMGSMVFGISLTGAGGTFVMQGFKEKMHWACPIDVPDCTTISKQQIASEESLITALQSVGAIFGAAFNSYPLDKIGRKWTIFAASLIFTIGALVQCLAPAIDVLCFGRFIGGFGIGMYAMSIPVYIGECSPTHKRGQLTTFWQVGVTVGLLTGTAVNLLVSDLQYGWRISYGFPLLFAVFVALAMATFMPESPRFLASREDSKLEQQRLYKVLHVLRYDYEVQSSSDNIKWEVRQERELGVATWAETFRKSDRIRYRVFLGVAMQFLNQLSGNETINFYAPKIFSSFFSDGQSLLSSFLLGIVNLAAVIFAIFTVDRVGRVPLWILGGVIMLGAQIANSILQSLEATDGIDLAFLVCLSLFTFAYHGTMGPLAWDVCAEMYPARERGKAVSLTTMSNFIGVVVVGSAFPYAMNESPAGCFAFFSIVLFTNMCLVYFFLPETAERTPLQIEEEFKIHHPMIVRNVLHKPHHH